MIFKGYDITKVVFTEKLGLKPRHQQVRALPSAKGGLIPAIALIAYAREDDRQRAITSGFQRHVTKPLEPEQLVQAVLALTRSELNHSMNPSYLV